MAIRILGQEEDSGHSFRILPSQEVEGPAKLGMLLLRTKAPDVAPRVDRPIRLEVSVLDLENSRAPIDVEPSSEWTGPDGRVHQVPTDRAAEGSYFVDLTPEDSGMHTWSITAGTAKTVTHFQVLP